MPNWETDWERERRKARERNNRSETEKTVRALIWTACLFAAAAWGYMLLKQHKVQILITTGDNGEPAVETSSVESTYETLTGKTEQPGTTEPLAAEPEREQNQPAITSRKRTVQEEYELASRIMESTKRPAQNPQTQNDSIRTQWGNFASQQAFNSWMLADYESHCLPFGAGSIAYRRCRAELKSWALEQCRETKLLYQRSSSNQRDLQKPLMDARCYAVNNYKIVE